MNIYLLLFLSQLFDDKKNFIQDVTNADIFKCVELNCELPGAGQLQVPSNDMPLSNIRSAIYV